MTKIPKTIVLPDLNFIQDERLREALEQISALIEENHRYYYEDARNRVITIPDGDTTPDVQDGRVFKTANTSGATAITDFDNAFDGQVITVIIGDANTSIADSGNFKLAGAFSPNADDVIQLVHSGGIWFEVSRSAN